MGAGKKRSWKEEVAMDKFSHYLSMASICSGRALEDKGTNSRTTQLVIPLKKELRTAQVT